MVLALSNAQKKTPQYYGHRRIQPLSFIFFTKVIFSNSVMTSFNRKYIKLSLVSFLFDCKCHHCHKLTEIAKP